jgi:hypothetical protein
VIERGPQWTCPLLYVQVILFVDSEHEVVVAHCVLGICQRRFSRPQMCRKSARLRRTEAAEQVELLPVRNMPSVRTAALWRLARLVNDKQPSDRCSRRMTVSFERSLCTTEGIYLFGPHYGYWLVGYQQNKFKINR